MRGHARQRAHSHIEHHHHVVHLGLGRASWQGTQGLTPTASTASLAVLVRRFRADPHVDGPERDCPSLQLGRRPNAGAPVIGVDGYDLQSLRQ